MRLNNPEQTTLFIFAYYSYWDPVFQSALLPYFENFPNKDRYRFVLLTWEQKKYRTSRSQREKIKQELLQHNIIWYNTNWHSGRLKLLKKAFDFAYGFILSLWLMVKHNAKGVYSEGVVGAIISHYLSVVTGKAHFIHSFEPHAQYMIEAGVWTNKSWEAKLQRSLERSMAKKSSGIFTATKAMIDRLNKETSGKAVCHRVPSCVDVELFSFSMEKRNEIRDKLGIKEGDRVLTYIGKFGGMYMEEEFFRLLKRFQSSSTNFLFHIFTHDDHEKVLELCREHGVDEKRVFLKSLKRNEVPAYLSASDFGMVPVRQHPGKRFCSPIKDGEYWACGLPILIPKGISDDYLIAEEKNIGVVLEDTSDLSIASVVNKVEHWFTTQDVDLVRERCTACAKEDRSVRKYQMLYDEIFSAL